MARLHLLTSAETEVKINKQRCIFLSVSWWAMVTIHFKPRTCPEVKLFIYIPIFCPLKSNDMIPQTVVPKVTWDTLDTTATPRGAVAHITFLKETHLSDTKKTVSMRYTRVSTLDCAICHIAAKLSFQWWLFQNNYGSKINMEAQIWFQVWGNFSALNRYLWWLTN